MAHNELYGGEDHIGDREPIEKFSAPGWQPPEALAGGEAVADITGGGTPDTDWLATTANKDSNSTASKARFAGSNMPRHAVGPSNQAGAGGAAQPTNQNVPRGRFSSRYF